MILDTPRFRVFHDISCHGQTTRKDYYYLTKPNSVAIVPFKTNRILFLRVKRYLTHSIRYELPGGRVESGETPLKTAKRELKEETGLTSKKWMYLGSTYPLPSITTERVYMYSAAIPLTDEVTLATHAREEGIIDCAFLDFRRVWRALSNNQVASPIDGFAAVLFLRRSHESRCR
jgi:ADP-ribose pyrophosphatase